MQQQNSYNEYEPKVLLNPEIIEWATSEEILQIIETPKTNTGDDIDIDLKSILDFDVSLGNQKYKLSKEKQTTPLLINIKENKFDDLDIEINTTMDLVCVIDISGSMSGQPLEYVKETMLQLIMTLSEKNRIAIVLFDDKSELLMNFKTLSTLNINKIKEIIESIQSRGSTNIRAGIHLGQEILGRRQSKNHVSSIFLLSDGEHNSGPIDHDILFSNDTDRSKCDYTLSSFGYGDNHDAKLLQMMSESKGGNYYFVNDIKKVDLCFMDCLGMMTSALGLNMIGIVKLQPSEIFQEIRFCKTFGPYWKDNGEIMKEFSFNAFYSGFQKNLLALIELNGVTQKIISQETRIKIGEIIISVDTLNKIPKTIKISKEIYVTLIPEKSIEEVKENEEVQKQLFRVEGADVMEVADQLKDGGKYDDAIKYMEDYQIKLEKQQFKNEDLFIEMNKAIDSQKISTQNDKNGIRNAYKSKNMAMQNKNIYMNECSAPLFSQNFQTKKQSKMSKNIW